MLIIQGWYAQKSIFWVSNQSYWSKLGKKWAKMSKNRVKSPKIMYIFIWHHINPKILLDCWINLQLTSKDRFKAVFLEIWGSRASFRAENGQKWRKIGSKFQNCTYFSIWHQITPRTPKDWSNNFKLTSKMHLRHFFSKFWV